MCYVYFSSLKITKRSVRKLSTNIQKLNNVPFEELRVGGRVISALGKNGVIVLINPDDDNWVEIEWEDSGRSGWYHPQWGDVVLYIGMGI